MANVNPPTQNEAVEHANLISANNGFNPNDKPEMIDPIVYTSGYSSNDVNGWDPKKLANANVNLSQYGDDSSSENYNIEQNRGGANQKYVGTNTLGSQVEYNPNATIEGLDPNYKYGQEGQMANSAEANYLAKRNDEIASALYNAGKTSMEDVSEFLNSQEGFRNSYENERQNTIMAVWKRLGQLQSQNSGQEENKPNEEAVQNMEQELNESTAGKIYGKDTADQSPIINTLEDDMNIYKAMNGARIQNFKNLQGMNSKDIATSIYFGITPYGEQGMRDLMQFDPSKYQEIQQELKILYTQDKVNEISTSSGSTGTYTDSIDENIKTDIDNWEKDITQTTGYEEVTGILDQNLSSNQTASSAKQEMLNIKKDMANLEQQLEDLPKTAEKVFKGDVPDYIYKAFIANNQQRIQSELNKLQSRYTGLSDMYKTEVANAQWQLEFDLKKQEMYRQLTNDEWDRYYKNQQLALDSVKWGTDSQGNMVAFQIDPTTGQMFQVTDGTAFASYQDAVNKTAVWAKGQIGKYTGLECTGFTNKISEGLAGVRMVGVKGAATAAEKVAYATNPSVSDVVPIAGDVAVMTYNGSNKVNQIWGHTMRVDNVYSDNNGDLWFHYIATNKEGRGKLYTQGYEGDMRVSDFYKNGGAGFWNPFKQAQYDNKGTQEEQGPSVNPMENVIDGLINTGKLNATQTANLSKFGFAYENLWRSKELGELNSLLEEGAAARFFQELAVSLANTQSGQSTKSTVGNAAKITLDEFIKQVEISAAQEFGGGGSAYMGFMAIVGVIESKLRKESGAAINGSERAMDFLQYLPQAGDTKNVMNRKLENLETFLKYWGKEGGITADKYIPIFGNNSNIKQTSTSKGQRFYF